MSRFIVRTVLDSNLDLRFRSYVYTGLFELHQRGDIELSYRFRPDPNINVVRLEVTRVADGAQREVVFDVHDRSTLYGRDLLPHCDIYFKRSLHEPDLPELSPAERAKIVPWGPIFGTSPQTRDYVALATRWLMDVAHAPFSKAAWRERSWNSWVYWNIQHYHWFEQPPDRPREPIVLFQPRVWTDNDVTGLPSAHDINTQRVELVALLRKTFKERFRGGVVPTPLARERYPEYLAETKTDKLSYMNLVNRSLVSINTMGLHRCMGWKLAESFAGSLCIVSDPIRNQLPNPITDQNVLVFQSNDECVAHCDRLLSDPKFATEMRKANHDYYRKHIVPPVNILGCLEQAFGEG